VVDDTTLLPRRLSLDALKENPNWAPVNPECAASIRTVARRGQRDADEPRIRSIQHARVIARPGNVRPANWRRGGPRAIAWANGCRCAACRITASCLRRDVELA